jgi:hypothetical protein
LRHGKLYKLNPRKAEFRKKLSNFHWPKFRSVERNCPFIRFTEIAPLPNLLSFFQHRHCGLLFFCHFFQLLLIFFNIVTARYYFSPKRLRRATTRPTSASTAATTAAPTASTSGIEFTKLHFGRNVLGHLFYLEVSTKKLHLKIANSNYCLFVD